MDNTVSDVSTLKKSTPLGKRIWACAIVFGLIGQIAWVVENMFFAKFGQDLFVTRGELYFTVTTAAVPLDFSDNASWGIIALLVILDCVMTFFGSTANDAAFNTWVADVTDVTNRGRVNTILSIMPVIATVLVFGIGMFTYDHDATTAATFIERDPLFIKLFFIIIGIFPLVGGVLAGFMMKDSPNIVKNANPNYIKETFYGFRPSVIRNNKMMYVTLATVCLLGIAQQTFMSYLINFISQTLGIDNYILPLAVIIVVGAVITGVLGVLFDKFGRKKFYFPLLAILVVGAIVVYCMGFMSEAAYLPILIVGGTVLLGAMLALAEGRFQGVRMCFTVLIPMALGILIAHFVGINSFDGQDPNAMKPPFELFLAAAIVVVLAAIPLIWVYKDSTRLRNELLQRGAAEAEIPSQPEVAETSPEDSANGEE